jgi:hypothetical protein
MSINVSDIAGVVDGTMGRVFKCDTEDGRYTGYEDRAPANGTDFSLEELQQMVGGHIEIVRLSSGYIIVIDEEGKLKGKPVNAPASLLYDISYPGIDDAIVGTAVWCKSEMVK